MQHHNQMERKKEAVTAVMAHMAKGVGYLMQFIPREAESQRSDVAWKDPRQPTDGTPQKLRICMTVRTALKTCFPLISAPRLIGCHLQPYILQMFSSKLHRFFPLQVESGEAVPLALNKRHGIVCGNMASYSRLFLMERYFSLHFPFPARAGIQNAFP